MSRFQKGSDGKYHVNGKPYIHLIGSRKQVWMGSAYKTDGQLVKSDFIMNKHRRIVSKKKHATAKKEKRLIKAGYGTKKGKFGFVLLGENKSKSRSRKQKGGVGGGATPVGDGMGGVTPAEAAADQRARTELNKRNALYAAERDREKERMDELKRL